MYSSVQCLRLHGRYGRPSKRKRRIRTISRQYASSSSDSFSISSGVESGYRRPYREGSALDHCEHDARLARRRTENRPTTTTERQLGLVSNEEPKSAERRKRREPHRHANEPRPRRASESERNTENQRRLHEQQQRGHGLDLDSGRQHRRENARGLLRRNKLARHRPSKSRPGHDGTHENHDVANVGGRAGAGASGSGPADRWFLKLFGMRGCHIVE